MLWLAVLLKKSLATLATVVVNVVVNYILIRSGYSELAQIVRRLSEYDAFDTEPINNKRKEGFSWPTIPSSGLR